MNDPNKSRDAGIADELADVGIDVAAEGAIDLAFETAGNVLSGAAEIAGELIGGIAEGI